MNVIYILKGQFIQMEKKKQKRFHCFLGTLILKCDAAACSAGLSYLRLLSFTISINRYMTQSVYIYHQYHIQDYVFVDGLNGSVKHEN